MGKWHLFYLSNYGRWHWILQTSCIGIQWTGDVSGFYFSLMKSLLFCLFPRNRGNYVWRVTSLEIFLWNYGQNSDISWTQTVQLKKSVRRFFGKLAHSGKKKENRKKPHSTTRLEIISDVVSEKARSGKIPIPHRLFPIPHRYFGCGIGKNRCGIGIFPLRVSQNSRTTNHFQTVQ